EVAGQPVQVIHPSVDFTIEYSDLRSVEDRERHARAVELATRDARLAFDLVRGPLFRFRLVTLQDDEHKLFLTAHQSIVDGITVFDIFPREFTTLYESFAAGHASPLPELPAQFADFSCWQRRKLHGGEREAQLGY